MIPATLALLLVAGCDRAGNEFSGDPAPFFVELGDRLPDVPEFHRRGKVLVLDADNRRIDPIHDRLPRAVQARTPDEVGTVGLVQCEEAVAGRYFLFVKGYTRSCRLRLVALPSLTVIENTAVSNLPPRRVWLPFWNRHAPRPNARLAEKIADLPDLGREMTTP